MNLKCVIIDDEPLARECIKNYVAKVDFLQLTGMGSNPVELVELLGTFQVELVFLDIQMPLMNGIDFLRIAKDMPMVIITTAYHKFALEGFQLDVLDYLVKPITFERFFKAVTKARDYHQLVLQSAVASDNDVYPANDYFFVKCDYKYEKIYFDDILYIQGLQNYVTIYTQKGQFITLLPLKIAEEKLNRNSFLRVHRSYVVSISKIDAVENNHIAIQSARIPIGRSYRAAVVDRVIYSKLWKKPGDD